jgi:hypothetical protein
MKLTAITHAVGTLTSTGVFSDTQTVTIGGKVYTTQTTLTNVDGNVLIGASAAATLQNLFDAINLSGTPGTQYATLMTVNPHCRATSNDATTLVVASKVPGAGGNYVPTTETQTNASWGATTLAGGTGSMAVAIEEIKAGAQMNAEVEQMLRTIDSNSLTF